jgi:hypothetical protein
MTQTGGSYYAEQFGNAHEALPPNVIHFEVLTFRSTQLVDQLDRSAKSDRRNRAGVVYRQSSATWKFATAATKKR